MSAAGGATAIGRLAIGPAWSRALQHRGAARINTSRQRNRGLPSIAPRRTARSAIGAFLLRAESNQRVTLDLAK